MSIHPDWFKPIRDYVECCSKSADSEKFKSLLSDHVILKHQTSDKEEYFGFGVAHIQELFKQKICKNTSKIELKGYTYSAQGEGVLLNIIEGDNRNASDESRHFFVGKKYMEFTTNKPIQIKLIRTIVNTEEIEKK